MLKTRNDSIANKNVLVSGSGNVAQFTTEKALQLGAKVLTLSDSNGFIYDPDGIDAEKLDYVKTLKNVYRGRIREYADKYSCLTARIKNLPYLRHFSQIYKTRALPSVSRAQVVAASLPTICPIVFPAKTPLVSTATGTLLSVVLPLPNCPKPFHPQQ